MSDAARASARPFDRVIIRTTRAVGGHFRVVPITPLVLVKVFVEGLGLAWGNLEEHHWHCEEEGGSLHGQVDFDNSSSVFVPVDAQLGRERSR